MIIAQKVYEELSQAFCASFSETGGMFGETEKGIVAFYFDRSGISRTDSYEPDIETMNRILEEWNRQGIFFAGLVHTHKKNRNLSQFDLDYGEKLVSVFQRAVVLGVFVTETKTLFLYQIDQKNGKRILSNIDYQTG